MRTQSIDTQPEAERVMIELIRGAPMSRRFRLVQSLTQSALWSSSHAWRERHREASEREAAGQVVSTCYGADLARRVQKALERRESWHVQPIDLLAAMRPLVAAYALDERYPPVRVASAYEMILFKLRRYQRDARSRSDGMRDDREWNDILGMLKVQGPALNLTLLERWAGALDGAEIWRQALVDAGLADA